MNYNVLAVCPSKVATGGTESIHKFVNGLNQCDGISAGILYAGETSDPQPKEYACYRCGYLTQLPEGYKGVIVFPEIWADAVTTPLHKDCVKAVNWAGWDVYQWNVPKRMQWKFLQEPGVIHIAQSEYAMENLRGLGLDPLKLSDVLHDDFFEPYEEEERNDVVLYNPAKLTPFGKNVIKESPFDFRPIFDMTRDQVIDTLRHAKLYIDFGEFSGRERIPREAAMCGCCVLTSTAGAADNAWDVAIPNRYKFRMDDKRIPEVIGTMADILSHYKDSTPDFEQYRISIRRDREDFKAEIEEIGLAFLEKL